MKRNPKVPIYEQYKDYEPPFNVRRAVERMVATVPDKYLVGLGSVVLTDETALNRKRARQMTQSRGKKVSAGKALGLYHPAWGSDPAWIELRIDSIFANFPRRLSFPLMREASLADVFFHELGHHIHAEHRPEFKEKEDIADRWSKKGTGNYIWRRFWYLAPFFRILRWADAVFDIRGRLTNRTTAKRS